MHRKHPASQAHHAPAPSSTMPPVTHSLGGSRLAVPGEREGGPA